MSAHEFMNMARVRAEQAEARAERAEAALDEVIRIVDGSLRLNEGFRDWESSAASYDARRIKFALLSRGYGDLL